MPPDNTTDPHAGGDLAVAGAPLARAHGAVVMLHGRGATAESILTLASELRVPGLAFIAPQVPGIATGFAIIWALSWRRQHRAVQAIEERDGVVFYVEPTSPLRPKRPQPARYLAWPVAEFRWRRCIRNRPRCPAPGL